MCLTEHETLAILTTDAYLCIKHDSHQKSEVAGIEPVPTVWNHRNPVVASTNRRVPSGLVGSRGVRLLTQSTANQLSVSAP